MPEVRVDELIDAGVLSVGDGYRTKRAEHGRPGFPNPPCRRRADGHVSFDGVELLRREFEPPSARKSAKQAMSCWPTKGTVGRVAIFPGGLEPVVYSPQLCYFRVRDESKLSSRYLAFWLRSTAFLAQAAYMSNSTDMAPYISLRDLRSAVLHLPEIEEQRGIAEVLGALDDKIAALDSTKQIATDLEDSRFEAALRNADSSVPLASVASVTKGVSYRRADLGPSSRALVTLKCVGRDGQFAARGLKPYVGEARAPQILRANDTVVAQTDLTQGAEVVGWAVRVPDSRLYDTMIASLDLAVVRPLGSLRREYLLGAMRLPSFRDHCRAGRAELRCSTLSEGLLSRSRYRSTTIAAPRS